MGETFSDILHKQKQRSRKEGSAQKEEGAQAAKERAPLARAQSFRSSAPPTRRLPRLAAVRAQSRGSRALGGCLSIWPITRLSRL